MSHFKNLIHLPKTSLPTYHCNSGLDKNFSFFKTQIFSNLELHVLVVYDLFFFSFHLSFCVCFLRNCRENRTLKATTRHDNSNHRTSKHASKGWRSDGPPSLPGWVITRVGPGLSPQCTRAHFGGEAVGCSPTAHKCHDSMSPNDYKGADIAPTW